jgi:hypothetical protein
MTLNRMSAIGRHQERDGNKSKKKDCVKIADTRDKMKMMLEVTVTC